MRELIHRGRGETVARVQTADETRKEEQRTVVVNCGIADVDTDAVTAVFRLNPFQVVGHFIKRFVPTNLLPAVGGAPHWLLEAIAVELNILKRDRFGTDVTVTENVVRVALDAQLPVWQ